MTFKDFVFLMHNWRIKGFSVVWIILAALIGAGSLILVYHDSAHAQISPATRPHTHAGASSGGSTLAPSTLKAIGGSANPDTTQSNVYVWALSGRPRVDFIDSSQSLDTKIWDVITLSGSLLFRTTDDAYSTASTAITFNRTANVATSIDIGPGVSLTSSKTCAANYTRIGPNFCQWTGALGTATTINAACTSIAAPSGAKAILGKAELTVKSQNALGLDQATLIVYNDATCVTQIDFYEADIREQVATAVNTLLFSTPLLIAPVVSGNAVFKQGTVTAGSTVTVRLQGYFD